MANKTLTATASWDAPKSTVNGDADDQALDEDCHQRHANRAEYLRAKVGAMLGDGTGNVAYFTAAFGQKGSSNDWYFTGYEWKQSGTTPENILLIFPIDSLPNGAIITSVSLRIVPNSHTALPANMPVLHLRSRALSLVASKVLQIHPPRLRISLLPMSLSFQVSAQPLTSFWVMERGTGARTWFQFKLQFLCRFLPCNLHFSIAGRVMKSLTPDGASLPDVQVYELKDSWGPQVIETPVQQLLNTIEYNKLQQGEQNRAQEDINSGFDSRLTDVESAGVPS